MTVRTRFAPSPTGYLHVGGARTALFCWAYARHHGGQFILRIEDTDVERSTQASVDAILQAMEWLGLDYDEGPFYQMQRMDRYKTVIQQLLSEGKAYKCYCTKDRLEVLRNEQMAKKQKPRYDQHCRAKESNEDNQPFVIRFKNPDEGKVSFDDQVRGLVTVKNSELDDLIIARSDGTPTYNFTVVVDDWDMNITHVIRGDDHINNTPRQINILKALGAELPVYCHVPMILGSDGKRLSKRHGAVSVLQYREGGVLADALLNYLVRLGWSHGDQEIFSKDEIVKLFDFNGLNRAAASFDNEKLLWLNQQYFKTLSSEEIADQLKTFMSVDLSQGPSLKAVVEHQIDRAKTLKEMAEKSEFFYKAPIHYDEKAAKQFLNEESLPVLKAVYQALETLTDWSSESIHAIIKQVAETLDVKMGKVAQPIRVAMTGNTVSPSIDVTLQLLGKANALARLDQGVRFIFS